MLSILNAEKIIKSIKGDLGEDDYLVPLNILIKSLKTEANLSFFGKLGTRYQLSSHLQNRANVNVFLKDHEGGDSSPPVFVMGLPRSGTTFLFNILSQDRHHRSPVFWEMMNPLPLAPKGSFLEKKRVLLAKGMLLFQRFLMPRLNQVHYIEADSPEECILIKTLSLRSLVYVYMANIPTYQKFLQEEDFKPAFKWHQRFIQCLETFEKPKRWLLKDPCHLEHLPEILSVYPNAKFIYINRDPSETIPSICSLTHKVRSGFSRKVSKELIGQSTLDFWSAVLGKYDQDRKLVDSTSIIDINYKDLINDPMKEMYKVYEHFDLDLDAQTETSMLSYINRSAKGHGGGHYYSPEEFGLTKDHIRKRLNLESK